MAGEFINNQKRDTVLKNIRFYFSIAFSLFIFLPLHIWTISKIFTDPLVKHPLFALWENFVLFIIALLPAYFVLYRSKWLRRFIFENLSVSVIFRLNLLGSSVISALLWGIFGFLAYESGTPFWFLFPLCGVLAGLIYGLLSSFVILILRKKFSIKRDGSIFFQGAVR